MITTKGNEVSVNQKNNEHKELKEIDVTNLSEQARVYFEARAALIEKYSKPKLESAA